MGTVKIIAVSDLHGLLPDYSKYYADICIIAGDIIPLNIQTNKLESLMWFEKDFINWCNNLNVSKVIFIGGNHDFFLANNNTYVHRLFGKRNHITYLCNDLIRYKGLTIFGTPYCKQFYDWAFMYSDSQLREFYSKIPQNVDILISHDCPYSIGDVCLQHKRDGHIGNHELLYAIQEKTPKLQLNGHLHSCIHYKIETEWTTHYNCSIIDDNYNLSYLPQIIEI